ncbi:uncharacterized protein LOC111106113 [Crassostrea virginica]
MKNLEISFALFFVIFTTKSAALVEWPFGTYTLVKPNAGCPSGWLEGWRYQDNEDHNNKNKMSYGQHFYGEYTRHKKKHFLLYCSYIIQVTRKQKIYILRIYFLFKFNNSIGFQTGSVYWDDEDRNNKNSYGGVLPSGDFGRNTRIDYCCREDGPYDNAVQLPTTQPFYFPMSDGSRDELRKRKC